ncbi:MAG TPA: hypothetical protein VK892_09810 [Pyrinomonadaceae bacterium]|nr:hypothetical protein [Pyrinomonadaceae bacterium]
MIGIGTHLKKFRENKSWLPLATLAALLVCIGLTVGFFINNSANESNQSVNAQPIIKPNENLAPPPRVLNLPPGASDSDVLENVEQAKTNSVSAEEIVEKAEIRDEPVARTEKIEKPKPSPLEKETTRPIIVVGQPRRNESQNQTRPRIAVSEDVPDIEVIFTGRRNERVRYEEDKGNHGKNSKEDWKENRRERKQRGKGKPFPF